MDPDLQLIYDKLLSIGEKVDTLPTIHDMASTAQANSQIMMKKWEVRPIGELFSPSWEPNLFPRDTYNQEQFYQAAVSDYSQIFASSGDNSYFMIREKAVPRPSVEWCELNGLYITQPGGYTETPYDLWLPGFPSYNTAQDEMVSASGLWIPGNVSYDQALAVWTGIELEWWTQINGSNEINNNYKALSLDIQGSYSTQQPEHHIEIELYDWITHSWSSAIGELRNGGELMIHHFYIPPSFVGMDGRLGVRLVHDASGFPLNNDDVLLVGMLGISMWQTGLGMDVSNQSIDNIAESATWRLLGTQYDDGWDDTYVGGLFKSLQSAEADIIAAMPEIPAPSGGGSVTIDTSLIVDELLETLKASDSIVMGQGNGSVIVDTTSEIYKTFRVTKDGFRGVKDVVVRVFSTDGANVDWDHIKGRCLTNTDGNWRMYLDAGNYIASFERNGIQLKTDELTVGTPPDVGIWGIWPPTNAAYVADADAVPGSSWMAITYDNDLGRSVPIERRFPDPWGTGFTFMSGTGGNECYQTVDGIPVQTKIKFNHMYEVMFSYGSLHSMGHGNDEFDIGISDINEDGTLGNEYLGMGYWESSTMGGAYFDTRTIISPENIDFYSTPLNKILSFWNRETNEYEVEGVLGIDLDDSDGVMKRLCLKEVEEYVAQPILGFASVDGDPGVGIYEDGFVKLRADTPIVVLDGGPFNGVQPDLNDDDMSIRVRVLIDAPGFSDQYFHLEVNENGYNRYETMYRMNNGLFMYEMAGMVGSTLTLKSTGVVTNSTWDNENGWTYDFIPLDANIVLLMNYIEIKPE